MLNNIIDEYLSSKPQENCCWFNHKWISRKDFKALADERINVRMIDQGASELNIIVGVLNRDFEDAVQSATASRINADYIITRNAKDFDGSTVNAITPEEYFAEIFTV